MRIRDFTLEGFKNLTVGVSAGELGPVEVIHGDNNVGKSNLLEALWILGEAVVTAARPGKADFPWTLPRLHFTEAFHLSPSEAFHRFRPRPIRLAATFEASDGTALPVRLAMHLEDRDRVQVVLEEGDPSALAAHLSGAARPMDILQVDRTHWGDGRPRDPHERALIPPGLALELYDAKESFDPHTLERWTLFTRIMARFGPLVGGQDWNVVYDRPNKSAHLVVEDGPQRLPAHLLGSGVQQLAALVGHLLMTTAPIVAIEEPELNLRQTHQRALRQALDAIVADPRGPSQILLTSHSDAFEGPRGFLAMEPGPDGPTLRRRPPEAAPAFLDRLAIGPIAHQAPASSGYLTSQGTVLLPERYREALGLPGGGGVVFETEDAPGAVRVLSNARWLEEVGLSEEPDGAA